MTLKEKPDAFPAADRPANFIRRQLLLGGAAAGVGVAAAAIHDGELGGPSQTLRGAVPWQEGTADVPPEVADAAGYTFFAPAEAAFIESAMARLIPDDPLGPGAVEAGVPVFLDRQLAGPYGRGDHFFLGGPWPKGTQQQGYQTRYNPAQLYRAAIAAIDKYATAHFGGVFSKLGPEDQDKLLQGLEKGDVVIDDADAKTFFAMLLQNTKEGYFSDPIYGGNKDMRAWKMIGFPGAHYDYKEWVSRHGERVPFPTVGFKGRPGWRTT